jgi:glucose/arabinose dehydrogenase
VRRSLLILIGTGLVLGVVIVTTAVSCFRWRSPEGGSQATFSGKRMVNSIDIAVPAEYAVEVVAEGLTFPTGVTFDDTGRPYVVEAGYSYGEAWDTPRLLRVDPKGGITVVADGENNGPWTGVSFHGGAFFVAEGGMLRGGRILRITLDGRTTVLLDGLPSMGDHQTNGPVVGPDGFLYFSVGTFTNSGVVGEDNYQFGWLVRFPHAHDTPCHDVTLTGENFTSANPFTPEKDTATTGAYMPFGTATSAGQVVHGTIPCNGAVFRLPLGGGRPDLVAWGLRNPFGLAFSPDGELYATDNSYDDRKHGNRSVHGAGDLLWRIREGSWYGWPDYHGQRRLDHGDHFIPPDKAAPKPLLAKVPAEPPEPAAVLDVHASADGFDFSRTERFGYVGHAFIALFGDQSPTSGKVVYPVGFKVVRVNPKTGVIEEFAVNKGRKNGPASKIGGGGFERPVAARFGPDGALYVVDFGVFTVGQSGKARKASAAPSEPSEPRRGTGVLWKITRIADH